jgi:DNA primase
MVSLKGTELTSLVNKVLKEVGRLRKGNNLQFHCPFCHHRKRKLEVCIEPPYMWHCWTCDAKGRGLHSLLGRMHASRDDIVKLKKIVGEERQKPSYNIFESVIKDGLDEDSKQEKQEALQLPQEFKSLIYDDKTIEYKLAARYAKKRHLTWCDIIKYNIGYCGRGKFANRLVFPSYDANNNLNFYSCRSYSDGGYKYQNSEFSKDIIGFENLVDFDFPIYLCEGALDAISLRRNAIPLFGKTLSHKLKSAIIQSKCPEINIVLDDDALTSAIDIAEYLTSVGKVAKLVQLRGKDPNVLGFEKTMEQIKNTNVLDFSALVKLKLG